MTPRNPHLERQAQDPYVDRWTPVHFVVGVLLGVLLPAFWALALLALWEPFVLLVLSQHLRGTKGILTRTQLAGPTLRNVLIDLVFDVAGVVVGVYLVRKLVGLGPLF